MVSPAFRLFLIALSAALFAAAPVLRAADTRPESGAFEHVSADGRATLRGLGKITVAPIGLAGAEGWRFECESPDRARVFLHKLGRDMAQSATVEARWETVRLGSRDAQVLVRPGLGSFLPLADGRTVFVFTSTATENLAAAFASAAGLPAAAQPFDPAFAYPVYLDKFSHYGIGSWYPSYWGDENTKGKPNAVGDHLAFARKLDLVVQPNAGGFILRNLLPILHEYGRPYHFAQWQEWSPELAIMAPEDLVVPSRDWTTMPSYYGQVSDGGRRLLRYRDWTFQNTVRGFADDPLLVDWLDPNGEVGPHSDFFYWDFGEPNRLNLVRYLRDARGYTLQSLGEAWYGDPARLKSWNNVPIPMSYEFYGWRAGDPVADRTWRIHPVRQASSAEEMKVPWYARKSDCPPSVRAGIADGVVKAGFDDSAWVAMDLPNGELGSIFWRTRPGAYWYRGTITAPAEWLAAARKSGRVYLTVASLDTNRGWRNPDRLWVNGVELATLQRCSGQDTLGQVDVTAVIREGRNSLVYLPAAGAGVGGPFFLTARPMEEFPFSDPHQNARFRDWHAYVSWCVMEKMENTFKAIRAVDPDRFIKMHAALDKQLGIPLAARYGCFGHNTGEGGFFRPWDKRFGYCYGVPASAEFGGYVNTVPGLQRWIGWFTFEGLNAFDNFHNIQEMMYAVNKDLWVQYLPYLKLAPRRDFKRPDIALLWSPFNSRVLPRPVPYSFDLGRGDLAFIGYSYVDASETTLRDGLADPYPVLWDTGTWLMEPATVARIRQYVEAGGTFVALHETGRHSYEKRDAWPIAELTGFQPGPERPMTGTLFILADQPVFKALAGKVFYNRGKSIDYSEYNYADKCFALRPAAEGTTALARYEDGEIAIGMRTLGKGRVIVLGSPFWRNSYDGAGMWWPGEDQCVFLEDLLAGLGLKPLAACDSHDIWREHFLANNGTEEYLALFNPFSEPRTFSVEWTTVNPAGTLYDPKTGGPVPGKVEGRNVRLEKVTLQGLETLIVASQPAQPPQDALRRWFDHLAWWWRPSAPGEVLERPALPFYELRLAERLAAKTVAGPAAAAVDCAALSTRTDPGADWILGAAQSPETLRRDPDPSRRCLYHVAFEAPPDWRPGDTFTLNVRTFSRTAAGPLGPIDAWLNGRQVLKSAKTDARGYSGLDGGAQADIGQAIKLGAHNVLVLAAGPYGFMGEVEVARRPAPAETIEVQGTWRLQPSADSLPTDAALPGRMTGLFAHIEVTVPAAWRGDRVFVRLDLPDTAAYDSFAINDKVVFHPVNWFKPVTYMDVSPWVKFGEANRLTLITKAATQQWQPGTLDVRHVVFERVRER